MAEGMQNFSEKVQLIRNEELGRHLVAAIDIEPGDVLLEERPLLLTPHWSCEQMKCAQCAEDSYVMCKKCGVFPLCLDCTAHDRFECDFFCTSAKDVSRNLLVKNYAIYGVLKLLLLMENTATAEHCHDLLPRNFQLDDYRATDMWREHEESVVEPLMRSGVLAAFKGAKAGAALDSDFLHRLCLLIDANAFEVKSTMSGDLLKGVYPHSAKMPHHCVPNVVVGVDEDYSMTIYAAVPIQSGQVIYNSYTNPLMGTSRRQHHLRTTRNIECECSRCRDPTELGTHMSSIRCPHCPDGYAVCDSVDDGNGSRWLCLECEATTDAPSVQKLLTDLGEEMANSNGDLSTYEDLLVKYAPQLHPNHFMLIDIKQNMVTILRHVLLNPMSGPGKRVLRRRLELCAELLPLVRAVLPGISKLYAIALYEYLLSFLELAELEFRFKDITDESFHHKLREAKEIAREAGQLLAFEPPKSPEGRLRRRIAMQLEQIEGHLQKLKAK